MSHRLCTSPRCSVQARATVSVRNLCQPCTNQVADVLTEIADHYEECAHELRLGHRRTGERVRGGMITGIRLSDATVDVRADILTIVSSWTAMVVHERGLPTPKRDVHAMTGLLRRNLDWLAEHPAAGDFADEMADLLASAHAVINSDRAPRLHLGFCPQPGCQRPVHATVQIRDRSARPLIKCESGHRYEADQWREIAA
ncbi:hypothetical protein D5S17_05775 [Pseudonocardiaceae bacterium YIM PH 21723]|nr:hypothetical protein D5S17_05775 [Pseudonocardiaceae bacterium YIM PH 21723]